MGEGGICWATERRHGSGQGFAVCTVGAIGYVIWAAEVRFSSGLDVAGALAMDTLSAAGR